MKERNFKGFRIDAEKLQKEIKKRGLTQVEVSEGIYKSRGYIKNVISEGKITGQSAILLEQVYNIKRADYEYIEPKTEQVTEVKEESPKVERIDYVQLYNTIYAAVLAALTKSKEDFIPNYGER